MGPVDIGGGGSCTRKKGLRIDRMKTVLAINETVYVEYMENVFPSPQLCTEWQLRLALI